MAGISEDITALTALLRCPVTGQQLRLAHPEQVKALTAHEAAKEADGFLVRHDGTGAYPVVKGIPSLLPESLLPLPTTPSA